LINKTELKCKFDSQMFCLGVWRGANDRILRGEKYRGKLKNLLYFLKSIFLEDDKPMFMIHIFLILKIL